VRDQRVVHVLEEDGRGAEEVEGDAVGNLEDIELFFFRENFVDVGFKAREGVEEFVAEGALGGGLDLGFRAGGESGGDVLGVEGGGAWGGRTDSFLNMVGG